MLWVTVSLTFDLMTPKSIGPSMSHVQLRKQLWGSVDLNNKTVSTFSDENFQEAKCGLNCLFMKLNNIKYIRLFIFQLDL